MTEFFLSTTWSPLFEKKEFGIWPLITGTLLTSMIALIVALPTGILISIFFSEVVDRKYRRLLKPTLELLAAIPTVVYGYFALVVLTPFMQNFLPNLQSFNALSAGIVMGLMILPTILSISDDSLQNVSHNLRLAGYALGATRLQVTFFIVVPAAGSGIFAASVLGLARAIGETMIVSIAAGQMPKLHFNPLEAVQTMTAYIAQVSLGDTPYGSLEFRTVFAVATVLFILTLILNFLALKLKISLNSV